MKFLPYWGGWEVGTREMHRQFTVGADTFRTGMNPENFPFFSYAPVVGGVPQYALARFFVDRDGNITARNATIWGQIIAGAGSNIDWSYIRNIVVTNAHIVSLDAGKINTGSLSAARLHTGIAYITTSAMIASAVIIDAHIVNLSADKINTGILTGRRIRTAETGTRVEIGDPGHPFFPHELIFYGLHDLAVGHIRGGGERTIFEGSYLFPSGIGAYPPCIWENPFGYRSLEIWETEMRTRGIRPIDNNFRDLGTFSFRWRDIYIGRDFNLGGIFYPAPASRVHGNLIPNTHNTFDLGTSTLKWSRFWGAVSACDLPTANSAIDVFKKIEKPILMKGHFGKRKYFEEDKFPEEMKIENKDKTSSIEVFHTLGVCVQAIRELIFKVEKLENKLKVEK